MAYTAVPTVSTGELWTAANQNAYLRDNMTALSLEFVPAIGGYNTTDTADIYPGAYGLAFPDNKLCAGSGFFYAKKTSPIAYAIIRPQGTGNVYSNNGFSSGADGEAWDTHGTSTGYGTTAVTDDNIHHVDQLTLTNASFGDHVALTWLRDGTHANDTVGATVYHQGFYIDNES